MESTEKVEKLSIPVIAGTSRKLRESIHAARLIVEIGKTLPEIDVALVDVLDYHFDQDGNDDAARDPRYTAITERADGFLIVVPEYNHSFPGSLKMLLDKELKNYIHKPVAFAGASSGLIGGARGIESLVTSVREMGLVATFTDVHFPRVQDLFDDKGKLLDDAYVKRVERVYKELIWMAKTLRYGRENII